MGKEKQLSAKEESNTSHKAGGAAQSSPLLEQNDGHKGSNLEQDASISPTATTLPSMATREYLDNLPASLGEATVKSRFVATALPSPSAGGAASEGEQSHTSSTKDSTSSSSSMASLFSRLLQLQFGQDPELPTIGARLERRYRGWLDYWTSPLSPLRPKDYVDAYTRPNPCPEEYWWASWRWPRTKYVNAKVPPPENGEYQDYYHYLAFKMWLERERDVYVAQANLAQEMLNRCIVKEGQYNAAKNCRHLYNKTFAMSRMEELNQTLLYMAITGNNAIRETPYPEDFVEVKRKVYDDWLYRTRLRKPGDVV